MHRMVVVQHENLASSGDTKYGNNPQQLCAHYLQKAAAVGSPPLAAGGPQSALHRQAATEISAASSSSMLSQQVICSLPHDMQLRRCTATSLSRVLQNSTSKGACECLF